MKVIKNEQIGNLANLLLKTNATKCFNSSNNNID